MHHTPRLERFRPVLSTLPSTKINISAKTCHENTASTQHPETQIPMSQPHPTPQKHYSPKANLNVTAQKTADLTKRCACAVKSSSTVLHTSTSYVSVSTRFLAISHQSDTSRFHPKPSPKGNAIGTAHLHDCNILSIKEVYGYQRECF